MEIEQIISIIDPNNPLFYNMEEENGYEEAAKIFDNALKEANQIILDFMSNTDNFINYPYLFVDYKKIHNTTIDLSFVNYLLNKKSPCKLFSDNYTQQQINDIVIVCLELICEVLSIVKDRK